ncbi:hypothetical protein FA13DRAFT_1709168 [Coprinellus micaceus]|uniref:Uncharacterized protein n=1 Tax=Coprinellus micaceus TaxID=71717 RepID=A0A4Y7TD65_COPMI|nr:hypothetical protein FA13DRAFT_1709168 [Coprinellus micaceus]
MPSFPLITYMFILWEKPACALIGICSIDGVERNTPPVCRTDGPQPTDTFPEHRLIPVPQNATHVLQLPIHTPRSLLLPPFPEDLSIVADTEVVHRPIILEGYGRRVNATFSRVRSSVQSTVIVLSEKSGMYKSLETGMGVYPFRSLVPDSTSTSATPPTPTSNFRPPKLSLAIMHSSYKIKRVHVEETAKLEGRQGALQPLASFNVINAFPSFSFTRMPTLKTFTFDMKASGGNKENVAPVATSAIATSVSAPHNAGSADATTSVTRMVGPMPKLTMRAPVSQEKREPRLPYTFDPALGPCGRGFDSVPLPPIALHFPRRIMRRYAACAQRACWANFYIDWALPAHLGARACGEILDEGQEVEEALCEDDD